MTAPASPALLFTLNDVEIAMRLVEGLVAHVKAAPAVPIGYDALLARARALHPRDVALARAVPLGIGPKLVLVARFCRQHGYPNLAALAVRSDTGGHALQAGEASAFALADWSLAPMQLAADAQAWRAAVPARLKPRAERPADVAWYAWFRSHRADCAHLTAPGKHEIINLVMAGLDPEAALRRVLAAQAECAV